jgi:AcrR family transcriptional regulator
VSPSKPVKRGAEPSEAQWRVINAALKLFARHGVGGTSLRMIAKELGVTQAAVYHQYNTKDEIIFAAADSELRRLEAVVAHAEAQPTAGAARDTLVAGMVDLSVGGAAGGIGAVLSDPAVIGTFDRHDRFVHLIPRMRRLLTGGGAGRGPDDEPRLRTATLIAVLNGAATHPFVADLDEATLREQLLLVARRLLPPLTEPGQPAPGA